MAGEPYYITTPIYYVTDEPHAGHATTTIYADALARFKRFDGYDVRFLTGTDEHGQKVEKMARARGFSPQEYADQIAQKYRDCWAALGLDEHQFIRTTDEFHVRAVRSLFEQLKRNDCFYKAPYEGLYCVECEQAYAPSGLVDGKCPVHKIEPVTVREDNYFFRLSRFEHMLRQRLDDETRDRSKDIPGVVPDANVIVPASRRNEILGKLREGLNDASVSRTAFTWGVEVPGDPGHVLYVWFDALINYFSALAKDAAEESSAETPPFEQLLAAPDVRRYWPRVHHLTGKEILWHHSVWWWPMLYGAGAELPHKLFVHGWWVFEGEKMSKSRGNVISPVAFAAKYSSDMLRYYILRDGPSKGDADWRHANFLTRINGELAGELGNLFSRVLGMLGKYHAGRVPAPERTSDGAAALERIALGLPVALRAAMDDFAFPKALDEIWALVREANRFVDRMEPFKLAKDPARAGELAGVMHALLQTLRVLAHVTAPFVPVASAKMKEQLGIGGEQLPLGEACHWAVVFVGTQTVKGDNLFPRLEE